MAIGKSASSAKDKVPLFSPASPSATEKDSPQEEMVTFPQNSTCNFLPKEGDYVQAPGGFSSQKRKSPAEKKRATIRTQYPVRKVADKLICQLQGFQAKMTSVSKQSSQPPRRTLAGSQGLLFRTTGEAQKSHCQLFPLKMWEG